MHDVVAADFSLERRAETWRTPRPGWPANGKIPRLHTVIYPRCTDGCRQRLAGAVRGSGHDLHIHAGSAERTLRQLVRTLVAIVDRNGYQLDGAVDDVMGIEPLDEKWRAFGWEVHVVDGHDIAELTAALRRAKADDARTRPCCIIARTLKGKGVSYMETEPGWHLGYLDPSDADAARAEILSKVI